MSLALHISAYAIKFLPVRLARRKASGHKISRLPVNGEPIEAQFLVDVSVIYKNDARTGIQRVVRALVLQLLKSPPAGYRICPVYATRQQGYHYAAANFLECSSVGMAESRPVEVQSGDLFLALDLAAHLLPRHQKQILSWKRKGIHLHAVVYDLLPVLHPEWFQPRTTRNFRHWLRWIAVYADSAICISQTVKAELHTWLKASFDLPPTALDANVILLGADIEASAPSKGLPANAQVLLEHMRSVPCVLMVGTIEPRKGHAQALAAFEKIWQQPGEGPALIIVGRAGWRTDELQQKLRGHSESNQRLYWLEDVSDEYLELLYANCCGVLVASHAEGFGLPVIEAALHKKPVLARDIPIFREIIAPKLSYFYNSTSQELAVSIDRWINKSWLQESFLPENLSESNFPSWKTSAAQLVQALGLRPPLGSTHERSQLKNTDEKSSTQAFNPC